MPKNEFDFFGGLLGDTIKKVKARKKRLKGESGKKRKPKKGKRKTGYPGESRG